MGIGSVERGGTRNDPNLDYRDYTFTKKDKRHTSPARSLYRSLQRVFGDIGETKTKPTVSTNK